MARLQFPLSGDVTQVFRLMTQTFSSVGSQFGFINIYNARSSAPEVEEEVLEAVGSYGRQLGRVCDALSVLVARLEASGETLNDDQRMALAGFKVMVEEINDIKQSHRRTPLRFFRGEASASGLR